MNPLMAALAWLEGSALATTVRESLMLTAALSAVHLLGVTLVGGGALASGLRLAGAWFPGRPAGEIVRPAGRLILLGLSIVVATGVPLVAPRATDAAGNGLFQLKMLTLAAAVAFHLALHRRVSGMAASDALHGRLRGVGVVASVLWIGVVAAGSAFILLE